MFDFFDNEFGQARVKPTGGRRVDPKSKFIEKAKFNLEQLEAGERATTWCNVQSDGSVIVTLRNGIRVLNPKKPQFVCPNVQMAGKYLQAALAAAEAGKFDDIFRLQHQPA